LFAQLRFARVAGVIPYKMRFTLNEYNDLFIGDKAEKPKQQWGSATISIATLLITFAGIKVEGFEWVLYLTAPLLLLAFFLMLSESSIASKVRELYRARRDKRVVARIEDQYQLFFDKFKIVPELISKVENLDWCETAKPRSPNFNNELSNLNRTLSYCDSKISRVFALNHMLNHYMDNVDSFLMECDCLVINRSIKYQCESKKSDLQKQLRKYDSFREDHDNFCKEINKNLNSSHLRCFYDHTFCFMPNEIESATQV